jgi:hypothetical protein
MTYWHLKVLPLYGLRAHFSLLHSERTSFALGGLHFGAAGFLLVAGCGDPTPFEPVTCAASVFGAGSLTAGGLTLSGLGALQVKDEVVPGIMQAITCEP